MTITIAMFFICICLATEAFFSGSEIAMVHADRMTLQRAASGGHEGARRALSLLEHEEELLGTCLIGTNLAVVTGSSIIATVLVQHGIQDGWTTLIFTPLVLVFGEALPKTILQHHADDAALIIAYPLTFARTLFRPFLAIVKPWKRLITRATGGESVEEHATREELLQLLSTETEGPIDDDERRLIRGVLALADSSVGECMTPLVRVVAVSATATVGVAVKTAIRTQHSRLPIFEERVDNIIGLVHQADLLFVQDDQSPIRTSIRGVRFVPEAKRADDLFREMRELGEHFAVVVDEFGGCVGIVTLEDLLEELVGDIEDERDVAQPTIVRRVDASWSLAGTAEIEDIFSATGIQLPEGDYETVAGLMLAHLGHIPTAGEQLLLDGLTLRVEDATDRAITRLSLQPWPSPPPQ